MRQITSRRFFERMRSIGTRLPIEWLEGRTLLSTFYPVVAAADGAANSLRAAIIEANSNGHDDTILLQAGTYGLTVPNSAGQENAAAEGDLDLTESNHSLIIRGAGTNKTIIDANGLDRVFQVFNNVTVLFKDLTITGGLRATTAVAALRPAAPILGAGGFSALVETFPCNP